MTDSAAPHAYADVVWNARTAHLRRAGFRRYHWQPIPDSPGELLPHGRGLPIRPGSFAYCWHATTVDNSCRCYFSKQSSYRQAVLFRRWSLFWLRWWPIGFDALPVHETYRLQQFEPIVERIVDVDVKLTAQIHH